MSRSDRPEIVVPAHRYHHGDLRAALLTTTRALLAESGLEALSIREVSRRAGVSNAAAYNHFTGRGELVRAVVDVAFAELAAVMRVEQGEARDPLERLRRAGQGYVRFAMARPAEFRTMFRPELFASGEPLGELALGTSEAYMVLTEAIAACLATGAIAGDEPTLVMAAWSAVHGLATLALDGPPAATLASDPAGVDSLARAITGIVARGMQPG
jgi:AcrR family transcriptional regulator